jgi:lysophospholipase L1-like esterase
VNYLADPIYQQCTHMAMDSPRKPGRPQVRGIAPQGTLPGCKLGRWYKVRCGGGVVNARRLIAILACACLAACGGGDSRDQSAKASAACTAKPVRIQLFGDSTMAGYDGATGKIGTTTPQGALQALMDTRVGPGAVQIASRAVLGTTALQLVAGTDGLNLPWPQSVDADIVVISFGINDYLAGEPVAQYQATLRTLAIAPAQVVWETPLPIFPGPVYASSLSYAPEMRAAVPIGADASAYVLSAPGWAAAHAADSVHPDAAGYFLLMRDVLEPALRPLVAKFRCAP